MGAFNTLTTELQCQNCTMGFDARIQFKFGDKWQYEYLIGDKIKWGGNDEGIHDLKNVKVYGILENDVCTTCGHKNPEVFDIYLSHDVIKEVRAMPNDKGRHYGGEGHCI